MALVVLYPPFAETSVDVELSPTQAKAVELVLLGYKNWEIAALLNWTYAQVQSATLKSYAKAGAHGRTQFVAMVYSGSVRLLVPV